MKKHATSVVMAAAMLALQGCSSTPGVAIDKSAEAKAIAANPKAPAPEDFPALGSAKWKQGAFPNLENLRKMAPGMGKDQVRDLLGWPHFSEGLGGVREWNYIFHFRTAGKSDYLTCQYMVRFDEAQLTTGEWWKPSTCASLVNPPAMVAVPPSPVRVPMQKVTLGADGLFRFDGGRLEDLHPEGKAKIEKLGRDIRANFRVLTAVRVVGHTDRLGAEPYNAALSQRRADTVRELLVREGLDGTKVTAVGRGEKEPVTKNCQGVKANPALVQCLQPDRRVEIEVVGEQ